MSQDSYEFLGLSVVVRSTSPQFASDVRRLLRSFYVASASGAPSDLMMSFVVAPPSKNQLVRSYHFVYNAHVRIGRTADYWQLFRFLEIQLIKFLGDQVTQAYLIHAGAVGNDEGGILLPGPSGSGKSSLTLGLVERGYSYFSDDLTAIDPPSGDLHPFPKPFSIKDTSIFPKLAYSADIWYGGEKKSGKEEQVWYLAADDLTSTARSGPVPVRYIIFPTYKPKAKPDIRAIEPNEAAQRLLDNSANFHRFGPKGLRLVARLVQNAKSFDLISGKLEHSLDLVRDVTTN